MKEYLKTPSAIRVTVCSHHFVVSNLSFHTQTHIQEFAERFINVEKRWVKKRLVTTEKERYFHEIRPAIYEPGVFRFHRHVLKQFLSFLAYKGYTKENFKVRLREETIPKPAKANFKWISKNKDLDYQIPVIKFALDNQSRTKAISMQTGKGKTYCAFRVMQERSVRTMIMVLPKYLERWRGDIINVYDLAGDNKLMIIDTTPKLHKFLSKPVPDENQVFLITTTTWGAYVNDYFENGWSSYPVEPALFNKHVKAGLRIIDEVHEHFHANFICDLYTNIENVLSLSATIDPKKNEFRDKMLKVALPPMYRVCPEYDKYIDVIAYKYYIRNANKLVRYRGFGGMYSHVKFEQSLLINPVLKKQYFDFVMVMVNENFLWIKKEGHRLLMLFHTQDMCDAFYLHIKKYVKDLRLENYNVKELTLCAYHGLTETTYADLEEKNFDIIISTKASCGTAVDIPRLTVTIMPACEESNTGNEQALGRTRKPKDGTVPRFVYTYCQDIPPQVLYHESKISYFKPLAKSQRVVCHNIVLGT